MEPTDGATVKTVASTGVLTRRMLGGVVFGVLAFAIVYRVVLALHDDATIAIAAGAAASLPVAAVMMWRTLAPLVKNQAELQVRYEAAVADALRDPLTGLGNHRAFHEELDRQVAAALRYEVPLSLMLIDIDEFKAINDSRGHANGDRVLRGFGTLLNTALRRADRAFRVGGDEFAVLFPHTDLEGARIVARRLLTQALEPTLRLDEVEPLSFSGGLSALPELGLGPAQLYSQADAALYAAKRGGRTEIVMFEPSMEVSELVAPRSRPWPRWSRGASSIRCTSRSSPSPTAASSASKVSSVPCRPLRSPTRCNSSPPPRPVGRSPTSTSPAWTRSSPARAACPPISS